MATRTPEPPKKGITRKFLGCSKIGDYEMIQKLGEGTFGEVHKARHCYTGQVYALKKILMHNEKDGFPITALREIKLLKMLSHDNVLKLEEMAVERPKAEGRKRAILYMVTPYMDHDLSGLLDNPEVRFSEAQIKCYMLQLFKGLAYLHDNHILHRDMKAANLLISNRGRLQIADFGLARHYHDPVPQRGRGNGEATRDYTSLVVTRWYRPPELLLQLRRYTPAIDMWGAGCVFGEMFTRKPILTGHSDLHQLQIICELVGTPNDQSMPGWDMLPGAQSVKTFQPSHGTLSSKFRNLNSAGLSLLSELLRLDWRKRINALDAIEHPYFKTDPRPMREEDIPTFADSHELDRRNARGQKQALPPAPAGGTVGEWNPSVGPPPNGAHWRGGDRDRYGPGPQDRGPPGVERPRGPPPYDRRGPHFDHRGPPPARNGPTWGGGHHRGGGPHHHPPGDGRYPPAYAHSDRDRDRVPRRNIDEYVPSYRDPDAPRPPVDRRSRDPDAPRPPVDRRSRDPDDRDRRRGSHDSGHSRDGGHRDDRSDRGRGYRDRDYNYGRDQRDRRGTRSRSPERRDRNRERERDSGVYNRR